MRRLLAVMVVVAMIGVTGCLGGGVIDQAAVGQDAEYDWNTNASASVNITDGTYQTVLTLENRTNVSLFGPGEFGGKAALPVEAVAYRYPNGTVANASVLSVEEIDERTVISAPEPGGQVAYTAQVRSSELYLSVAVNGTHAVTLPPGAEIGFPIIGGATPRGYTVERGADRLTVTWENPDSQLVTVDYYQERNLYLFGFLIAGALLVAAGGFLYFRSQLRVLAARRGDLGPETSPNRSEDQ